MFLLDTQGLSCLWDRRPPRGVTDRQSDIWACICWETPGSVNPRVLTCSKLSTCSLRPCPRLSSVLSVGKAGP